MHAETATILNELKTTLKTMHFDEHQPWAQGFNQAITEVLDLIDDIAHNRTAGPKA